MLKFNRELNVSYGVRTQLSPLVSHILAPNPGPFTFKGTGVHLVGAGERVAVIDPGPDMAEHLSALKRVIGTRRVSHILITHSHRDHSPAAAALKSWSGAPVYGLPDHAAPSGQEGAVDEAHDHDFVPDVMVHDGMEIAGDGFSLECVTTPGHTANHVCYALREEKALFSGDHVMGWSTSVIAPPDGDMGQYIASLEKLRTRDETLFYPTHGSPIPDSKGWVEQLIAHRRQREQQILEALRAGACDIAQLARRLYPDIAPGLQAAAAQQVNAHLLHLAEKSAVTRDGALWRPVS
ncbi:MAG TPA: MBL fold metallo-hydrolase [Rhizomicrobium sp.]|nr:MBL fold metallo-hydrolase [Rhizomicrobium sp.]